MWQPSPPPKPPRKGVEYLLQMASYYRDLVEYYQNAAEQAQLRLTYVEALLAESTVKEATFSVVRDNDGLSDEQEQLGVTADTEPSLPGPPQSTSSQEAEPESGEEAIAPSHTQTTPQELESLSSEAPSQELAEVESQPSEPDEKPIPKTQPKSRIKGGKPTSLPSSPRLKEYQSLPEAISRYLKEQSPSECSVGEVFDWLYPQGLSKEKGNKAKKAINNALLNYRGRMGWERVGLGRYAWAGS